MSQLGKFLSSEVRAEILRLLFDGKNSAIHLRQIHRQTSFALRTIQREVENLKDLDLVKREKDGNRLYYKANLDHPLNGVISQLILKTSGIPERIRDALSELDGIEVCFIFGSFAKDATGAHSDVDLIVVGDIGLRALLPRLNKVGLMIGREINPHILSKKTLRQKVKAKDHFFATVLREPKIFLIGNEDELK